MEMLNWAASWRRARDRFDSLTWAPLPLRLMIGFGFLEHGFAKLMKGPDKFVAIVDALGVPMPSLMAWLTILIELIGGLLLMAGAFVAPLVLPMAAVLLIALFTVHIQFGFTSIKLIAVTADGPKFGPPGMETDLLYLAGLLALLLGGPGPLAFDDWLSARLQTRRSVERS